MPAGARILILTNGPLCRNPRVVKEATTLGRAGYAVTVITIRNHADSEIQDVALMQDAPFHRIPVDMLPGYAAPPATIFIRRVRLWVARKLARFPWFQSIHSLGPAAALLDAARAQPADLVITHNEIAHWAGIRLLAEGRLVAADIEDWHSEDLLPDARRQRPLTRLRHIEHDLLHRAAYTTTTSESLAAALHVRYGGRRPEVLTNSFPLQALAPRPATGGPPAFFWFSQTLGPGRGLEAFVAAWTRMREPSRLVLLGESAGSFARDLLASVPAERQTHLEFLDLVPPHALPGLIARHDIGLALELAEIPNRDLTITNKILQYLDAGLAVVATDTRGQQEVLAHAPDAGIIISLADPTELAHQLDRLVADRPRLAARQAVARRLAESTYCWEHEAPKLLARVGATIAQTG